MSYQCRIVADSTYLGSRLTTFVVTFPRIILAEFNTHRVMCLAGDSMLEFDLPGEHRGARRVHRMTISEFVGKWIYGAEPHKTRWGGTRTYDLKPRLREMRIRQMDEATGDIITSTVADAIESGMKPVYEVRAGRYRIAGSADHRVMTEDGWKVIGELRVGDSLVVSTCRKSGLVTIDSIGYRGVEPTYDLAIAGPFPNFLANKVVVHNSRNSASSRAIPTERLIQAVLDDPFIPDSWGSNQPGMQAGEEIPFVTQAVASWLGARDEAVATVKQLHALHIHKQLTNRLLEPWMWTTCVVTSSTYENFFKLRCHTAAQPEIARIAHMMRRCMTMNTPHKLNTNEWHLPFAQPGDIDAVKVSVARCARVSYVKHDQEKTLAEDIALHDRLAESGHWSPFEHQALAMTPYVGDDDRSGNFGYPWGQYRKRFNTEAGHG